MAKKGNSDNKDKSIDKKRRRFLLGASSTLGIVGVAAAGIPFVSALFPSKREKAVGGPIRVKVGKMKVGDQMTVVWRGKPIWIVRRSQAMIDELPKLDSELRDPNSDTPQQPEYAHNFYRSIKKDFLVLVGLCTHLGCVPTYRPDPKSVSANWEGGFYCSCHGSKFDLAGRVFKGVPAPINLEVPPYVFINDDEILIGTHDASTVV